MGIAIIALIGVAVSSAVSTALRAAERTHAAALDNARLLQLDDRFRSVVGRVRPPWWELKLEIEESGGTWRVPYLDGKKEKILTVSFHDGTLSIDDGAYTSTYPGFTSVGLATARDRSDTAYGLSLSLANAKGREKSLVARLGGIPLLEREAQ